MDEIKKINIKKIASARQPESDRDPIDLREAEQSIMADVKSRGLGSTIIIILVLAAIIFGGIYMLKKTGIWSSASAPVVANAPAAPAVNSNPSDYQAVFLINGQVYFGKLSSESSQFPILRDIYYLQVQEVLQPAQTKDGKATQEKQQGVSLVKLGGELHGPTDEMRLNRDQILLIENLREDSNVVKAIAEYQAAQAKQ